MNSTYIIGIDFVYERHHLKWCRSAVWEMANSMMGRFRPTSQTHFCPEAILVAQGQSVRLGHTSPPKVSERE